MNAEANRPGPNGAELKPRAKPPTQAERLLRHARKGNPLDQLEWFSEAPDGLGPITALRSRVADLQRQGHRFRHVRRRGSLHVYWLVSELQPEAEHQVEDDAAEQLALAPPSPTPVAAVPHWRDGL